VKPNRFAAIILAAGLSRRMGQFKPLLLIGGETITDRVASLFLENGVDVILVTGWQGNSLIDGIKSRDITVVENPDYKKDMFSSVRVGISRLQPAHQAFFVMPVDIPLVRAATIKRILDVATEHPGKIIQPVFRGTRGHPPLIPSSLVPVIMDWRKSGGLKAVLRAHSEALIEVMVPDENILLDADNRDDFTAHLERFRHYEIPSDCECAALMDIAGTPDNVQRHCRKVAEVAIGIAESLIAAGQNVNVGMVRAASVLHDITKGHQEHASSGGWLLKASGFEKVGAIVAAHTDLKAGESAESLESKIVFLADKFVRDEEIVSIRERYRSAMEKYVAIPEVAGKILKWESHCLMVKEEIEKLLGHSLDEIVFKQPSE